MKITQIHTPRICVTGISVFNPKIIHFYGERLILHLIFSYLRPIIQIIVNDQFFSIQGLIRNLTCIIFNNNGVTTIILNQQFVLLHTIINSRLILNWSFFNY